MANINLSWIVTLVILTVVIGVVLGASVYHNINGGATGISAPTSAAASPAGAVQPIPAAEQSIAVPYIDPAAIDRLLYPFREVFKVAQQFGDLAERQNQIRAEQIATDGLEQEQALQRSIAQQEARQTMELQHALAMVAMGASEVLVVALAVSLIAFAVLSGWGRLCVARAHAAQLAAQTQAAALDAKPSKQQEQQWKTIWRTVGDLTRQQTNLKNELDAMRRAVANTPSTLPSRRDYGDLPRAE